MVGVVWTPVDRRPMTNERIYYEIRDPITEYCVHKLPGQPHHGAAEGWLYLCHKRWLLFYIWREDDFEVLRVVDRILDLPRQF